MTRVLVAGGGVAALETILALRDLAEERVSIELLAPEPQFWYRPLAVVEPFEDAAVRGIEIAEIAEACGAAFTLDALASVDVNGRVARTAQGAEYSYDALVIASGARPVEAIPGALTFRGPADTGRVRAVLEELATGAVRRLVFAAPGGVTWSLPLYELALLTAAFAARNGIETAQLALVTPETAPLALFGDPASETVLEMLAAAGIRFVADSYPIALGGAGLELAPAGRVDADRVIALPRFRGNPIPGIPRDAQGFIPVDRYGCVTGLDDVYAAGDATAFPVKHGGLAAQQARVVAEAIAARAGAPVRPRPFSPVLRGLLLTGAAPAYLRSDLTAGSGGATRVESEPIWWPPGKIVGQHLAPFLALRRAVVLSPPSAAQTIAVEVDLGAASPASTEEIRHAS
jgi:sulfide:quinone oxidoreductase